MIRINLNNYVASVTPNNPVHKKPEVPQHRPHLPAKKVDQRPEKNVKPKAVASSPNISKKIETTVQKKEQLKQEPTPLVETVEPEKMVAETEAIASETLEQTSDKRSEDQLMVSEEVKESSAQPAVAQVSPEQEYLQQHLKEIARLLQENLYYPRIARKRGITGEVIVAFDLLENGEASAIKVHSGERSVLNKAAIATIERLSGNFPKPKHPITLHVPIRYQLQ